MYEFMSDPNTFHELMVEPDSEAEKYFINDNKLKQSNKKKIPLSDAEKEQKLLQYLKIMANRYSYYSQNPYPANLTKTEFNKLCTIKIPILNEKNEPTDEFEDVHVSKLPQLMRTRPDAQWIKNRTVISFLGFQNSVSSLVKNDIKELVQLLSLCQNSIIWGTSSSALQKHIGKIEKKINEQQGIENFMDETSLDYLNIYQLYPYEMKTVEEYFNSMGSSEIKKFLQETEEKFYDSF